MVFTRRDQAQYGKFCAYPAGAGSADLARPKGGSLGMQPQVALAVIL